MTRQRYAGLAMELARRVQIKFGNESSVKLGKVLSYYRNMKIDWVKAREVGINSYKDAWNHPVMVDLRRSVEM